MDTTRILPLMIVALVACDTTGPARTQGHSFRAPEGLAVADDLVVVANSAFEGEAFGDGSITVVDGVGMEAIATIPTSAKNPQFVTTTPELVVVTCTGETRYDAKTGVNTAVTAGAVDLFERDTLRTADAPLASIPLPVSKSDARHGGPGSLVVLPDGHTAYVGSGLSAVVFKVDLATREVLRGTDDPIVVREHALNDTVMLALHSSGRVLVSSFNGNAIYELDPASDTVTGAPVDVGLTADLEGVVDLLTRNDGGYPDVVFLKTIANAVGTWDTRSGQAGVKPAVATTGVACNRGVLDGGFLYIVNSGENNVQRVSLDDPNDSVRPFAPLPLASNPWDMAVGGGRGYVTLFLSNRVAVVDLTTGALLGEVE